MTDPGRIQTVTAMASRMRRKSLEMAHGAGANGAHLGPALSAVEILACLYGGILRPEEEGGPRRLKDVFLPSKAHCVLAYYTALAFSGHFPVEDLDAFEVNGSDFPGHPVMNAARGIETSGGSLGMAPSQAVGIALAFRRKGLDGRVFVLLGDGECDEGSVWEAAMSAAQFGLDTLVFIVDNNHLKYDGPVDPMMDSDHLGRKFGAFGFDVERVDGHAVPELYAALARAAASTAGKPTAIIAETVKGKGVSFMENRKEWHHGRMSAEQYARAIEEVGE